MMDARALAAAASHGLAALQAVLDKHPGVDIDVRLENQAEDTHNGQTALFVAVRAGDAVAARVLIAKGAAVDAQKAGGFTPAYIAAQEGHTEALKLLIAAKANLNKANKNGATQLALLRRTVTQRRSRSSSQPRRM